MADEIDWRKHSANFAHEEKCPPTIETLQAAWARDQELILDQKRENSRLKDKINQLRQRLAKAKGADQAPNNTLTVWAIPVRDNGRRTTFYTETLPFVPGPGVEQIGEPVAYIRET